MTTETIQIAAAEPVRQAARPAVQKDVAFDAMRGMAILMVVLGHVHIAGFAFAKSPEHHWNYWFTLIQRQFELCAVPLFLFVSGYLGGHVRFHTKSDYTAFLRRRLSRIMLPYLVWSALFITLYLYADKMLTPGNFLLRLAIGGGDGPYYFIILLFQCYLLAPVFSYLADRRLGALFVIVPHVLFLLFLYYLRLNVFTEDNYAGMPVFIYFSWPCLTWFTFFYLGIYSRRNPEWCVRIHMSLLFAGIALSFAAMMGEAVILLRAGHGEMASSTYRLTCYAYSLCIVLICFRLRRARWPRALVTLGEFTFGIFFIHMFLLRGLESFTRHITPLYNIQPAYQLLNFTIVLTACFAIIIGTRKLIGKERASKWLGF